MEPKGEVRSIPTMLLLWLVTCGVYPLYWWYTVSKEINAFLGTSRVNPFLLPLLIPMTCGLYWFYFLFVEGKNIIKEVQVKAGLPEDPPLIADPFRIQAALNRVWQSN